LDEQTQELFKEKQKYVYAILESKVLTDRGKAIVRDHEDTFDAQEVYKKLTEHHLRSTKALIESSNILSYITSAQLGSGEWNGTSEVTIYLMARSVSCWKMLLLPLSLNYVKSRLMLILRRLRMEGT
jgi:hypothetical protein